MALAYVDDLKIFFNIVNVFNVRKRQANVDYVMNWSGAKKLNINI